MAGRKSTKPAAAVAEVSEAEMIESKTEDIKAETAGSKAAETKKAEPKKTAGKRGSAKAEAVKEEPAKTTGRKTASQTAKKVEKTTSLYVQYAGKSYSQEELVKIAKDVWKYDLKRKTGDLNSISLYVKPEENKVYYVMNEECTGSFDI